MIQFSPTQRILLQLLSDGACHNGTQLGEILGVTRSAIWKQINQLIALGLPINRLSHQGYQLNNQLGLLNEEEINNHLPDEYAKTFNLHLFASIDSTNRYLKDLPLSAQVDVCCAEIQTQGRGRFGRHWHSPFGENIYCSSRWNLNCDLSRLSGLSLVVSLAVLATVNSFIPSTEVKVKWPNDILWRDKKLCGSLIEINAESNSNAQIIIGVGLNVNSDTLHNPLPDKPWCSLYEISQQRYDRNILMASLIQHLHIYLDRFMSHGLETFVAEWNAVDYLKNKDITVNQSTTTFAGIACGINNMGQLIVEDEQGVKHCFSSGDTSLSGVCSEQC